MQNKIWDYFDRKVCLTITNRKSGKPSRWPKAQAEFRRVGLEGVEKFEAVEGIGPHQSFTLSQKKILQDFVASKSRVLLALEDDVIFDHLSPLEDAIQDIERNKYKWDIMYLGGNVLDDRPIFFRRNLRQVQKVWTTHAVAYTRFAAASLLQNFPNENEQMYDTYLGNLLPAFKAYMIYPMIATQRPDFSEIWGHDVDYTNVFKNSNLKLR